MISATANNFYFNASSSICNANKLKTMMYSFHFYHKGSEAYFVNDIKIKIGYLRCSGFLDTF